MSSLCQQFARRDVIRKEHSIRSAVNWSVQCLPHLLSVVQVAEKHNRRSIKKTADAVLYASSSLRTNTFARSGRDSHAQYHTVIVKSISAVGTRVNGWRIVIEGLQR